jgi:hypothetical protein
LVGEQVQSITCEVPLPSSSSALPLTPIAKTSREISVEVELRILTPGGGGLTVPLRGRTRQLSTGGTSLLVSGLTVAGHNLLAFGPEPMVNSLMLKLHLPDGDPQALGAVGEVIWARRNEEEDSAAPFLIGIEFKHLRPESRERLHNFLTLSGPAPRPD